MNTVSDRREKLLGQAPVANRKDIRNAVEAARGAATTAPGERLPREARPRRRAPRAPRADCAAPQALLGA